MYSTVSYCSNPCFVCMFLIEERWRETLVMSRVSVQLFNYPWISLIICITMLFSRTTPQLVILSNLSLHRLPSSQFPSHVAPSSPTARVNNNHGNLPALYSRRVPANSPPHSSHSHFRPPPRLATWSPSAILVLRPARPRALQFSPFALHPRFSPPASRMFVSTERLSSAWRHSPMKWNPLPWFVGALLLVLIQYRRHYSEKEVHVDEDGHQVVKLKGPWQVGLPISRRHT